MPDQSYHNPVGYQGNSVMQVIPPSGDPTGYTDTLAINTALASNGITQLLGGTYYVTKLTPVTGSILAGSGMDNTLINAVNPAVDAVTATDQRYITLRDFMLQGPGSGTGRGIALLSSASPLANLCLENLRVSGFGGQGVRLETPIVSVLRNVRVESCGGDYFYLQNGTSCVLDSCYANTSTVTTVNGYQIHAMSYTVLNGCAADGIVGSGAGGGAAYLINGGQSITLNGCGNERSAIGYKVTGSADAVVFNGCETYQETNTGLLVTSGTNVVANAFKERLPNGATSSVNIGAGCTALVAMKSVTTAATFAAGTAYELTATGGTAH